MEVLAPAGAPPVASRMLKVEPVLAFDPAAAPAARVTVTVPFRLLAEAGPPVARLPLPMLLIVTVDVAVVPTRTKSVALDDGDTDSIGATPVPDNVIAVVVVLSPLKVPVALMVVEAVPVTVGALNVNVTVALALSPLLFVLPSTAEKALFVTLLMDSPEAVSLDVPVAVITDVAEPADPPTNAKIDTGFELDDTEIVADAVDTPPSAMRSAIRDVADTREAFTPRS